jgi:hypothetical protein
MTSKPAEQVGGNHYSRLTIEPIQFIEANGLGYSEGNIVKYISRWKNKNGLEDLNKAKWYVERLIQVEEERLAENRRDELTAAIELNCPSSCEEPCEACPVDDAPTVTRYISDLHFFGWNEMSSDRRLEIQVEAQRSGRDILEVLRDLAESCSDDEARLIWTKQNGQEKA